jgi:RNA polymerase sigma-70 factor (ECF subfamily)
MGDSIQDLEWQRWVEANVSRFLLFARQKARSESDAQDLVQEAVLEATERQFNGAPPPAALVFATIHRRAIDNARSEDRRLERERRASAWEEQVWFDTRVEDQETRTLMERALRQLPDAYREVITLKIWGELTFAEIAEALSIPANTAASRYRYGLTELRKLTKGVFA